MGLFSRKPKKLELPKIPRFPDFSEPSSFSGKNDLPRYEEQVKDDLFVKPRLPPLEEPKFDLPLRPKAPPLLPRISEQRMPQEEMLRSVPAPENPIYVKIEKYREAVKTIHDIKSKIDGS